MNIGGDPLPLMNWTRDPGDKRSSLSGLQSRISLREESFS
jgi:hypothetical protein